MIGMALLRRVFVGFRRSLDLLTQLLSVFAGVFMVGVMLLMTLDVTLRNTSGRPLAGLVDWTELLLVLMVFLGIAEAQRTGEHVAIDVVADKFPRWLRSGSYLIGGSVGLTVALGLAYSNTRNAVDSYAIREFRRGLAEVPIWPGRIVLALGFILFSLQIIATSIHRFRAAHFGETDATVWSDQDT
jgi:TRAP-type C4-dicarboxylate transport system permease small subunit